MSLLRVAAFCGLLLTQSCDLQRFHTVTKQHEKQFFDALCLDPNSFPLTWTDSTIIYADWSTISINIDHGIRWKKQEWERKRNDDITITFHRSDSTQTLITLRFSLSKKAKEWVWAETVQDIIWSILRQKNVTLAWMSIWWKNIDPSTNDVCRRYSYSELIAIIEREWVYSFILLCIEK